MGERKGHIHWYSYMRSWCRFDEDPGIQGLNPTGPLAV